METRSDRGQPARDNSGRPAGPVSLSEEMVGTLQRNKAARVPRCPEDVACVSDANRVVGRRMHNKQRPAKGSDATSQIRRPDILDEVPPEGQGLATNQERRLAFLENPFQQGVVVVFNMSWLVWRADAHHGTHLIDQMRCSYDRRTAEGVADE
jgi:hypothetical protein